jgi:hypothetical protein
MIFLFIALAFICGLLVLFFQTPEYLRWEAKRREKQIAKSQKESKPQREARNRLIREETLPTYRELFRKGPVGYWCDPEYDYMRVVVYKDWRFREDGTGDFIFFTSGGGENISPFLWKSTGDFKIHMTAVLPDDYDKEEEDDEEDSPQENEKVFCSFIPREIEVTYDFVFASEDSNTVWLRSDKYVPDKEQPLGEIGLLSLGLTYEQIKKRFSGK